MSKNIEPKLKLISEYLRLDKDNNFIIPEYQRGYSWESDRCDKLFNDIETFSNEDPYFFGTIILDCSIVKKLSLIDGQQRTTTFLLLLKALLIRLNEAIAKIQDKTDEDTKNLLKGLEKRKDDILKILYDIDVEDSGEIKKEKIQNRNNIENKSINELHKEEFNKILRYDTFEEIEKHTYKISRKKHDNKYTQYFKNFKFFYFKLEKKDSTEINKFAKIFLDKCQVIEIRSWDVEQAIVMFNTLNSDALPLSDTDIISAQLFAKSNDKEKFNEEWEKINELSDELHHKKITNLNSILNQYMYIDRANKNISDVTLQGLRKYYLDKNNKLIDNSEQLCNNIQIIIDNWNDNINKPIVKLALKFNENIKIFLSCFLFGHRNISDRDMIKICESLIKLFTIMELVDAGYSSNNFKQFLFDENIKFVNEKISIDEITEDFSNHIIAKWDKKNIQERIEEYDKNILIFLNEYLYTKENGQEFDFQESTNIEHIMPSSGRNISTIRTDANLNNEDFRDLVNKIGNKILLEEDINKSIGNEWFKTKKQSSVKEKTGYKDSSFGIAKSLITYERDTWTKEDIENANKKASERIIKFLF